jgi:hypothetical protein
MLAMAPTPLPTRYVRCKVSLGIFETEFYVSIKESAAAYVDRSFVKVPHIPEMSDELDGHVLAYLVREDEHNGHALVELSGEAVVGGLRNWVPQSHLMPA